jgi:hypothetical protein
MRVISVIQVTAVEISQNLPPKIALSQSTMTERPAAFQLLPYMELSDPEAGWSNVTVTIQITPLNSQLQAPLSSFQLKRWIPWDLPQATVRNSILQSCFKNSKLTFSVGCEHSSHRLSWIHLPKS